MHLKIAIIGFGSIAIKHISILRYLYGRNIFISVFKRTKVNVDKKFLKLIDQFYNSLDKASDVYDKIIIASPSSYVFRLSRFGKKSNHFFIEKPITADYGASMRMKRTQERFNHSVIIGYVCRFSNAYREFKKTILGVRSKIQSVTVVSHSYLPEWRKNIDFKKSVSFSPKLWKCLEGVES